MGSLARGIIRERVNPSLVETCIASAEKAFHQSFEEDSKTSMPEEMQEIYGSQRFNAVASNALMQYAEDDDQLYLTVSRFVSRIKGDPRMMYEVLPLMHLGSNRPCRPARQSMEPALNAAQASQFKC